MMVVYNVNWNYIDVEPMWDYRPNSMIKAYQALWSRITQKPAEEPTMYILENEASNELKREIRKNCKLQFVPPDTH